MASWFFGGKREPQSFADFVPPAGSGQGDGNNKAPPKTEMDAYRFDSAALERAAAAAKDLEKSKFSKEALDLAKQQEAKKIKEIELQIAQIKIEAKTKDFEENRRLLQEQSKMDQQKAQYQDQLARKRYEDQILQQRKLNEETNRKQEESVKRQEALRRETFEQELEKSALREQKRLESEYSAKGRYERENKDLFLQKMKQEKEQDRETTLAKLREQRETTLQSLQSMSSIIGHGLDDLISNKNKLKNVVLLTVGIAAGFFTAKRGSRTIFNYLQANLVQPQMVSKTSRITFIDFLKHPIKMCKKLKVKSSDVLEDVILHPEVDARVRDIAISIKNLKKNKGYFMNFTLYGPPGTGKTMFAEKLAINSGMEYAIVAGGDLSIPGKNSVTQLHKLFDWAESTRKGMVLFIDEADAFMFKRETTNTSDEHNKILSAFLHRTGKPSKKFTVVLATNRPDAFDHAITSRSSEFVVFPLPTFNERQRMIMKYFNDFILVPSTTGFGRLKIGKFSYKTACNEVARITEGFSGRDIFNLANYWQSTTYASEDGLFSEELMMSKTHDAIQQNKLKKMWSSQLEKDREMFSLALIKHVTENKIEDITSEKKNSNTTENKSDEKK